MRRRVLMLLVVLCTALMAQAPVGAAASEAPDKPHTDAVTGETESYIVEFEDKASLDAAFTIGDFAGRGQFVVDQLTATASAAQRDVLRAIKATAGASAESYWLRNVVVFTGDEALAERIATMAGVKTVRHETTYQINRPVEAHPAEGAEGAEWGVARIGAPGVWSLGITGSGIVVGSLDSGVEYLHPALVDHYRGNNGDGTFTHDYNWFDASGDCPTAEPCDLFGHGTHTMGTMVGGDGPGPFTPDIGVAPGAEWMTVSCGPGFCSESQLLAAGQFFLAPTDLNGENPDPSMRPDIINNSWGGPPGDPFFLDMVEAWRAAGIVPVFASGNPGPFCGDGGSPGDYLAAFSAGATDIDDVIADFSGRGPSAFGKINPDVSAPGVDVVSSVPGGGYEAFSGTSMATPHVVGALALLMSAAPGLIGDVDGATSILSLTAMDIIDLSCGGDEDGDPNNVYGEGRIDVAAAVELAATGGTLSGVITDGATGSPIAGARVSADNGERSFGTTSGAGGAFKLFLQEGVYTVTASAFGYETAVVPGAEVIVDTTTIVDVALTPLPTGTVKGSVIQANDGAKLKGAVLTVLGTPLRPIALAKSKYEVTLPVGTYTLQVSQGGCASTERAEVEVLGGEKVEQNFELLRFIDDFGYGCSILTNPKLEEGKVPDSLWFDDNVGRLPLQFDFPFYGETYRQVFITTNGYVTFDPTFFSEFFNTAIPSSGTPNNAIYALWQDLWVDEDAQVRTTSKGGEWSIVYDDVSPLGGSANVDFAITINKKGRIDVVYGDGVASVGNGSSATVGIEAPGGATGVQYSFREPSLRSGQGIRYEVLDTGFVGGTVINANDGGPVAGARITAVPSGRSTTTGADGAYLLRLLPDDYLITASGAGYDSETKSAAVSVNATTIVDFALQAPSILVVPESIAATVDLGATATIPLHIFNEGSAPLTWTAAGIETNVSPPVLPDLTALLGDQTFRRSAAWAAPELPAALRSAEARVVHPTFEGPLDIIISDPIGDASGIDVSVVRGGADDVEASIEINIVEGSIFETVGLVYLDTDQNADTGLPAEALNGLPSQDVGMEYFVDLFAAPEGFALLIDAAVFEVVAEVEIEFGENSMRFDIPLEAIGDDGEMNVAMVIGNFEQPTDWVPDEGHGDLAGGRPAAWIDLSPAGGVLEPGESSIVDVTLAAGTPGLYEGEIRLDSNDPRQGRVKVPTTLDVLLPANFGIVEGAVVDAFFGFPIAGAMVSAVAEHDGLPYTPADTTGPDGDFQLFLPEGSWPMTTTNEAYESDERLVTVTAGTTTFEEVTLVPFGAIAGLEFEDMFFVLGPDETEARTMTLRNDGNVPMTYRIVEAEIPGFHRSPSVTYAADTSSTERPVATSGRPAPANGGGGGSWLVLLDALPWDSEALFIELDGNGVAFDVAPSEAMGEIDLSGYDVVIVANDQPQPFYNAYNAHLPWFEEYVAAGGVLWVGAASLGFNGGAFGEGQLPGGTSIIEGVFEDFNTVVDPGHPLVADVPDPFAGNAASHSGFDGVDFIDPPADVVAVGFDTGIPTLIAYEFGGGNVVASGQPLEFGWEVGEPSGQILINMIPYLGSLVGPPPDVVWLSASPSEGIVEPGESLVIDVVADATGLEPGFYSAELRVRTDDLFGSMFVVPVDLEVMALL